MATRNVFRTSRSLNALFAVLLTFATSAPALAHVTCLMSGRSELSLGTANDGCPEGTKHSHAVLKATCCVFENTHAERPDLVAASALRVPVPKAMYVPLSALAPLCWVNSPVCCVAHERPPPMGSRERTATLGVFRI